AVGQAADGAAVTFRELDGRALAWVEKVTGSPAAGVSRLQELRGRAVGFAMPNSIAWLEIFLGLLKVGAVAVPLDAGEPTGSQRQLAVSLRAGFHWDGSSLTALPGARRYRDPAVCLIKVTSGSTGRPRALVFTADQMLAD